MRIQWKADGHGCPSQAWAFVAARDGAYGLVLSFRPGYAGWRGFVAPGAKGDQDLLSRDLQWSADVLAQAGLAFREEDLAGAQVALVRLLAEGLGVKVEEVEPARNGRPVRRKAAVSGAQLHQIARMQPRRR